MRNSFPDWAAIMLFYAALHTLESAFASEGVHTVTHAQRELYIKLRHPRVWPAYSRLKTESLKARYLEGGGFSLPAMAVDAELRRLKFRDVRLYVRSLLRPAR